jgi:predicted RNase H-like HicB family nuclease
MQLTIRSLRETDGRWIGDMPELPGVTVYGSTPEEAALKARALALRVIAEEIEHGGMQPEGKRGQARPGPFSQSLPNSHGASAS